MGTEKGAKMKPSERIDQLAKDFVLESQEEAKRILPGQPGAQLLSSASLYDPLTRTVAITKLRDLQEDLRQSRMSITTVVGRIREAILLLET